MPTPQQYLTRAHRQRAYRKRQALAQQKQQQAKGLPPSPAIPTLASQARWRALHEQAVSALRTLQTEMQDYYDERSEAWQDSERGEAHLSRVEALESVLIDLDTCL